MSNVLIMINLSYQQRVFVEYLVNHQCDSFDAHNNLFSILGLKTIIKRGTYYKADSTLLNTLGKKYGNEYKKYLKNVGLGNK